MLGISATWGGGDPSTFGNPFSPLQRGPGGARIYEDGQFKPRGAAAPDDRLAHAAVARGFPRRPPTHPIDPPRLQTGEIDFDTWRARLKQSGVQGDIDGKIETAQTHKLAFKRRSAEAELRAAERYQTSGYQVEFADETAKNLHETHPDLHITPPNGSKLRAEVKAREPDAQVTGTYLENQIGDANKQIRKSVTKRGDILIDASQGAPVDQAVVEQSLKNKVWGNRMEQSNEARSRSVDYVEVLYQDGGALKRTIIFRDAAGNVQGPVTEIIRSAP
jgi:hypothetical protein